jgi:hypothetical protein
MLNGANLPFTFWAEAVNTAVYIRNRSTSKGLGIVDKTPEEVWTGRKPNISNLRKFGCKAYAMINEYRHKLQPKARKCIFLSYENDSKAYRLWNTETNKIFIS